MSTTSVIRMRPCVLTRSSDISKVKSPLPMTISACRSALYIVPDCADTAEDIGWSLIACPFEMHTEKKYFATDVVNGESHCKSSSPYELDGLSAPSRAIHPNTLQQDKHATRSCAHSAGKTGPGWCHNNRFRSTALMRLLNAKDIPLPLERSNLASVRSLSRATSASAKNKTREFQEMISGKWMLSVSSPKLSAAKPKSSRKAPLFSSATAGSPGGTTAQSVRTASRVCWCCSSGANAAHPTSPNTVLLMKSSLRTMHVQLREERANTVRLGLHLSDIIAPSTVAIGVGVCVLWVQFYVQYLEQHVL
eukprot:3647486-Amphidinium_carterae.4